ncbi:hypothetical protein [Luteolibacter luteus]|uniref:Uncharacterized protein n=1 Tax=Luteolibacter luteus TaxID=2728835 RepID=A0A858RIS7_9BACT|nr:hypothetical protein [Luteolibacter luteus]QJE97136.1 hypothetical protein HHL09_15515 [Luteolibacter luteus]
MALQESWHIRSRGRSCAATERPFEDGEKIMTALFPDPESSGYLRKDYCLDAWKARTAEDEKPLSFWKTVYHAPVVGEKPDAFKKESPEELLRRLVEEEEDHTENVRYILAVMLERQKVLRETDTQRTPSGILRVYEHRKQGDLFIVRDPDIPLSQVEKVQEEVVMLLETGGRIPDPEEIAAAETPAEVEASAPAEAVSETEVEAQGAGNEEEPAPPDEEISRGEPDQEDAGDELIVDGESVDAELAAAEEILPDVESDYVASNEEE